MRARGFTLVEVLVAMLVIAMGVGALLTTLMISANAANHLRDKSLAQWIAFNRVSEARLASSRPGPGVTHGTVEYANAVWRWEQQVADAGVSGLMRIDVRVTRIGDAGAVADLAGAEPVANGDAGVDSRPSLGQAIGFFGTAMARPNGLTPEWSPRPPPGPGDGGGGGGRDGS
jgi:general secretion pathway protein I